MVQSFDRSFPFPVEMIWVNVICISANLGLRWQLAIRTIYQVVYSLGQIYRDLDGHNPIRIKLILRQTFYY